jgi:hypothetical protein
MRNVKQIALAAIIVAAVGITTKAMGAGPAAATSDPSLVKAGSTEVLELFTAVGSTTFTAAAPNGAAGVNFVQGATTTAGTGFKVIDDTHVIVTTPNALTKGPCTVNIVDGNAGPTILATGSISVTGANRVLQVSVNMTLGHNATIAWDQTCDDNDTNTQPKSVAGTHNGVGVNGSITPYIWFVRDSDFGVPPAAAQINLSSVYNTTAAGTIFATTDTENAHNLVILAKSATNSKVLIDAFASDDSTVPNPWTIGAPNTDVVQIDGNLTGAGAGTTTLLRDASVNLLPATACTPAGINKTLNLQVSTPTASTAAAGVNHVVTVSLVITGQ